MLASLEPGGGASAQTAGQPAPVKLFIHEVPLTVLGKKVRVVAIDQANGVQGYSPQQADGFHVVVVNQLPVPTTLHWHGLIEPNAQDGVPYVTQDPDPAPRLAGL
ncbi:MAG: multicopper oxidase domain-containing protein [Verrucomicrobiota bacterium]